MKFEMEEGAVVIDIPEDEIETLKYCLETVDDPGEAKNTLAANHPTLSDKQISYILTVLDKVVSPQGREMLEALKWLEENASSGIAFADAEIAKRLLTNLPRDDGTVETDPSRGGKIVHQLYGLGAERVSVVPSDNGQEITSQSAMTKIIVSVNDNPVDWREVFDIMSVLARTLPEEMKLEHPMDREQMDIVVSL